MRLHVLSDLHLEFAPFTPPHPEADLVVLAGDVHVGEAVVPWILKQFPDRQVVYVLGNHEFYGEATPALIHQLRAAFAGTNVHLLENDAVEIGGFTILGCTLWTDFQLFSAAPLAELIAEDLLSDYRLIRISPAFRRLRASDTARFHADSRHWLEQRLAQADPARTVVVTHHAPSGQSLRAEHTTDPASAAFASNLDSLIIASGVPLWIHGHTHHSVDYRLGATRVLANQRGYPQETGTGFEPALVVEI